MSRPDAILIAGPTASGKSALAARLAGRCGGVVINADSMQLYRDLRILTARPSETDMAGAPHALFGTVDGAAPYSVSHWLADAARQLEAAQTAGLLPIFAGGTGLYFKALTQGLSDIPPVPEAVRRAVRAEAEGYSARQLHDRLNGVDPLAAARVRLTDPQRILRALEVHAATARSLVAYQHSRSKPLVDIRRCTAVFLAVDRPILRMRIDARFDAMMENGALNEVRLLSDRRLDPALPVMRAHGVPPLLRHIREDLALDDAVAIGKADTRRYLKRQETFARHQLPGFACVEAREAEAFVLESICLPPPIQGVLP